MHLLRGHLFNPTSPLIDLQHFPVDFHAVVPEYTLDSRRDLVVVARSEGQNCWAGAREADAEEAGMGEWGESGEDFGETGNLELVGATRGERAGGG